MSILSDKFKEALVASSRMDEETYSFIKGISGYSVAVEDYLAERSREDFISLFGDTGMSDYMAERAELFETVGDPSKDAEIVAINNAYKDYMSGFFSKDKIDRNVRPTSI